MYRHDPQLTGRSQFVGPTKGIIADTITFWYLCSSVVIDNENNIYIPILDSTDICSYNADNRLINWKLKFSAHIPENPNTPSILSTGDIIYSGKRLFAFSKNGSLSWEFSTGNNEITNPLEQTDKSGNIYFIESQTLKCISPQRQILWSFTYPGLWLPKFAFSPDGKTLYVPIGHNTSLLALDVSTQQIKWTFGTLPLLASPIVDNQGNIYFQKSSTTTSADTFFCLNPHGDIRWQYVYQKGNSEAKYNDYYEPTIDLDGNIYFIAPKDTLVSVKNDGTIRWKLPLQTYNGSYSPLVCDASNTIFLTTGDNHLISVSQSGKILWQIKFAFPHELYNTPSLMEGKLILTANSGNVYVVE